MVAIRRVRLDELEVPLVEPFETSFGIERRRRFLVVQIEAEEGDVGLGECVASQHPLYSSETVATARWMIESYLLPLLWKEGALPPGTFRTRARIWRGHPMAKAAVEMALWDLWARRHRQSLARALGGRRRRVEVGVSVGIQSDVPTLVRRVGEYLAEGYRRIKIKVRPGWDERPVAALRREFPDLRLWVDANQGYPATAVGAIRRWATRYAIEQVEQPFAEHALAAHARLARRAAYRVCLDESITDLATFDAAVEMNAVTSLNVKAGRVGGLGAGRELGSRSTVAGVPAWVGGMLETGIGRAQNVALASLATFTLPADLSASDRYYRQDLVEPAFELGPGSTLTVPRGRGLGVEVLESVYRKHVRRHREFHRKTP
ncbi:MAG: o-succinylbenzoate synthase [Thermoplasmata archaeon]|nr:o-succinylbenzoate synthase [Thermoplasmata archaeon]